MLTVLLTSLVLPFHGREPTALPFQIAIGCYLLLAAAGILSSFWRGVGYVLTVEEFGVVLLSCARFSSQEWEQAIAGTAFFLLISSAFVGRGDGVSPLRGKWLRASLQGLPILISVFPLWSSSDLLSYPRNPMLSSLLLVAVVGAGVSLVARQILAKDSRPVFGTNASQ